MILHAIGFFQGFEEVESSACLAEGYEIFVEKKVEGKVHLKSLLKRISDIEEVSDYDVNLVLEENG